MQSTSTINPHTVEKVKNKIYPVILAGGAGTRLWPLSRKNFPKQFQTFFGEQSMLQQTIERIIPLVTEKPLIVCNEEHRFIAAEQLRQINKLDHNIILEPQGRNTASAIALAAQVVAEKDPQGILLVLPADHVISKSQSFIQGLQTALSIVEQDYLLTFGIKPTHPETGYGYIQTGSVIYHSVEDNRVVNDSIPESYAIYQVTNFYEKPQAERAQDFIASGNCYWNSGMFMFKAQAYLHEIARLSPEIAKTTKLSLEEASKDLDFIRVSKVYAQSPDISVDYAVMEKTNKAVVMPLDIGWNDIGSWQAIWEVADKDQNGNAIRGNAITIDSNNNYVRSENSFIGLVGVNDLVVVQTRDAIYVSSKDKAQDIKKLISNIETSKNQELLTQHRKVYRPWGSMTTLDNGERFVVKRITVLPSKKVAMQMHHHRSEHWVVVSGTALVTVNEQEQLVTENQSVYIPLGSKHQIKNVGSIDLHLIEVQSGSYISDKDVIRFGEDFYNQP